MNYCETEMSSGVGGGGRERGGVDVYETLCPQQMLVLKGGKIKNWGGVWTEMSHLQKLQCQKIQRALQIC